MYWSAGMKIADCDAGTGTGDPAVAAGMAEGARSPRSNTVAIMVKLLLRSAAVCAVDAGAMTFGMPRQSQLSIEAALVKVARIHDGHATLVARGGNARRKRQCAARRV
jgi:hypothetical protein